MEQLNELRRLAGIPLQEEKRTRNFNEMMRQAKSIKMDLRGGREDLDPHIEVILKNGDIVYISADPNGKTIGWDMKMKLEALHEKPSRTPGYC